MKKTTSVTLSEDVAEWLTANIKNRSAYIECLIRQDAKLPENFRKGEEG